MDWFGVSIVCSSLSNLNFTEFLGLVRQAAILKVYTFEMTAVARVSRLFKLLLMFRSNHRRFLNTMLRMFSYLLASVWCWMVFFLFQEKSDHICGHQQIFFAK